MHVLWVVQVMWYFQCRYCCSHTYALTHTHTHTHTHTQYRYFETYWRCGISVVVTSVVVVEPYFAVEPPATDLFAVEPRATELRSCSFHLSVVLSAGLSICDHCVLRKSPLFSLLALLWGPSYHETSWAVWDVMQFFGCDIVFLVLCWMLRHIYIWLFQAFHTQTPWTLCTINMLHIICTTVYSIVKPTSSLLLASSIGTIPSTRRGGVLVICWYLRISVDFPRRFSISVSHIWLSCSPLVIQWCFYHH